MIYDVAVIGLGGMGSATAATAAARGAKVIGLEQFTPVHALGASHGRSRLIRMAYFEGPQYVPLLRRAYELWGFLEAQTGAALFSRTGGLFVGEPVTNLISGTLASAREHSLDVQVLDERDLALRYPEVRALPGEIGIFERAAGVLNPEATVKAYQALARAEGADLRFETRVEEWEREGTRIALTLRGGQTVRAHRLAICAGPWFSQAVGNVAIPFKVERNVQVWFDPLPGTDLGPAHFSAFALERDGNFFYGFPDYGDGVKCAFHHTGVFTTPQTLNRSVSKNEIAAVRAQLAEIVPSAAGAYRDASACMYALSADEHFIIGAHPHQENVFIAGGFSGHGFKFVPVIGEIMSNFLIDGTAQHAIERFAPERFLEMH